MFIARQLFRSGLERAVYTMPSVGPQIACWWVHLKARLVSANGWNQGGSQQQLLQLENDLKMLDSFAL